MADQIIFQRAFLSVHLSADIAFDFALLDTFALIELFLSASYGDIHFDLSSFIIHRDRDNCQPLLGLALGEVVELFSREQKFASSAFVEAFWRVFWLKGGDIGTNEKRLISADDDM